MAAGTALGLEAEESPGCFQLLSVPAFWIALDACSSSYSQRVALLAVSKVKGYHLHTSLLGLLWKIHWAGKKYALHVEKMWHIRLLMPLYRERILWSAWHAQNNCGDGLDSEMQMSLWRVCPKAAGNVSTHQSHPWLRSGGCADRLSVDGENFRAGWLKWHCFTDTLRTVYLPSLLKYHL